MKNACELSLGSERLAGGTREIPVFTGYKRRTYDELVKRVDYSNPNTLLGLSFGDLAGFRRRQAGISQQRLAETSGLSVDTIRGIEKGRTRHAPDTFKDYLQGLRLPPDDPGLGRLHERYQIDEATLVFPNDPDAEKERHIPPVSTRDIGLPYQERPQLTEVTDPSTLERFRFAQMASFLRELAGFSRQDLADAAGVAMTTIYRIETHGTRPSKKALTRYQRGLGLPDDDPGLQLLYEKLLAERPPRGRRPDPQA